MSFNERREAWNNAVINGSLLGDFEEVDYVVTRTVSSSKQTNNNLKTYMASMVAIS
ncbi:hypothetical protein EUX98_g4916 [Antrodiella citrinella]|uniref:Uncharacterized protein n=1 Tax=Antrodiella citrinella TaxID=2447956 RepID=A0A4S4MUL2_9APHY|nr:hypothetical protein EUX98_g4916 [Antrodiella citrinella]